MNVAALFLAFLLTPPAPPTAVPVWGLFPWGEPLTKPRPLFVDGFESGDLSGWTTIHQDNKETTDAKPSNPR